MAIWASMAARGGAHPAMSGGYRTSSRKSSLRGEMTGQRIRPPAHAVDVRGQSLAIADQRAAIKSQRAAPTTQRDWRMGHRATKSRFEGGIMAPLVERMARLEQRSTLQVMLTRLVDEGTNHAVAIARDCDL